MADAIFISYRRDDSEGEAGRLFDDLTRAFGDEAVFMDVAGIKPGVDFRKAIDDNVKTCGVLLAVVGPRWISVAGADGTRRLEDPNDFVALEIAAALRRDVPVIPVLVHDAKMPTANLLPESMKSFCYRNSVELSHARWNSDVRLLIEALKSYVTPGTSPSAGSVHANLPIQLPPTHAPTSTALLVAKKSRLPTRMVFAVAAVLLVLGVVVLALRSSPPAPSATAASPSPPVATPTATVSRSRPSSGAPRAARPDPALSPVVASPPVRAVAVPPTGVVKIMNGHSGLCLSPAGGVNDRNAEIVQYLCDEDKSRSWRVTAAGGDLYRIVNMSNGLCLTVAGGVADRNAVAVQYLCDEDLSRKWRYVELDGGMFRFINFGSELCLTVAGSVTERNARAVQFPCDGDPARDWKFISLQ